MQESEASLRRLEAGYGRTPRRCCTLIWQPVTGHDSSPANQAYGVHCPVILPCQVD
ncbi:hypothetical protein DVU_2550 [Nitratidesulfovibrio vulgaris str. Hildenborough]|uniref:Uncharacterized protein n=1 Tax=Nitratidesulfovibrio vulgaris (strain ATCC 29579 / DSM 644 / CCUG 34227 / NCIMB 8303 / VKM B-1760 / Hildenborough) TaxID=882 RepID=Q728Q3_NITV2|nr:hypothetical protein DVU_2550 [Nitratidesulfovibrio vulgaris str. Hildenborough]